MEDALAAVHDGQFILAHKLFAELLVVERVGGFPPTVLAGVIGVDGLLAQHGGQLFEGSRLLAAQEDGGIHVADDGIGVVLVDSFQLGLCLQHQTGGDLTAADGGDQLFQLGNLADIGALVNEAAHMDRQPPAIYIVRLFAQEVEKLGIAHGDQKVKAIVRVAHNEEQSGSPVSQGIQLQLVVGSNLPQLCNVEHGEARTAGNQDGLCGFAYCSKTKLVFLPQVMNLEDELVRCTDIRSITELTRSKSTKDFKRDFCAMTNCRSALDRHQLDVLRLWTQNPPEVFRFIPSNSNTIKL